MCGPLGDPPRLFQRQVPPRTSPADTRFPKQSHSLPPPAPARSVCSNAHQAQSECWAKHPRQQIHHVLLSTAADARIVLVRLGVEKVTTFSERSLARSGGGS